MLAPLRQQEQELEQERDAPSLRQRAQQRFDRVFLGAEKLEDYYDDSFRYYSRLGYVLAAFVGIFLIWSYFATVDEVSRGEGKVVPSSKTQVVQSLEGGIAKEIYVRQGQPIRKGQTLMLLDDTGFSASMGELSAKQSSLRAQIIRLQHEVTGTSTSALPEFPADLRTDAPEVVDSELRLFQARKTAYDNQSAILSERLRQR
ncbi:MAG: hypothetical protein AB7E67_16470, partial [Xanthobacteraceae bacterium]